MEREKDWMHRIRTCDGIKQGQGINRRHLLPIDDPDEQTEETEDVKSIKI